MIRTDISVEDAVVEVLESTGPCCLDDLTMRFPNHDWSDIFLAVDQMSRDGRLVLQRIHGLGYQVSIPSRSPIYEEVHA